MADEYSLADEIHLVCWWVPLVALLQRVGWLDGFGWYQRCYVLFQHGFHSWIAQH
jgi:hypothetical protein